jgi:5-methylcytosine-specific restriction endonuclease McrA
MPKDPFKLPSSYEAIFGEKPRKKRIRLTPGERIKIWEHPEIYGRTCSICGKRITKLSDLQLDHTKPYSKGGTKLALAHADCNRIKASRNLKTVQKRLGIKQPKKKRQRKKKSQRKKPSSVFDLPKIKLPKDYI